MASHSGRWAAALLLTVLVLTLDDVQAARALLQGDGQVQVPDAVAPAQPAADPFGAQFELVSDELLVKFKPGATEERKGKALAKGNAAEKSVVRLGKGPERMLDDEGDLSLVGVAGQPGRARLRAAAKKIQADEDVEFVEPNYIYHHTQAVVPSATELSSLWGMQAGGGGANAVGAWDAGFTNCSDIVVGLIDTGVQITHPDLADSIWTNPGEAAGTTGRDDDGNGFVDDISGWDFAGGNAGVYDSATDDDHGTHTCGTIGAVANTIGVVGVCPSGVKVIPAKFLGAAGGTTANAVRSLDYLLDLKTRHSLNMVATSNSWGGGGYSSALEGAIRRHNDAGILFIAAAGNANTNNDATATYPCNYNVPNVISVGSIDSSGGRSSFSNYGATTVDLFAPGGGIRSTLAFNTYGSYSGTSMATPHVSGAAALFAAAYKQAQGVLPLAGLIKYRLMQTGVSEPAYQTLCASGKRLNIANLLAAVNDPEPDPTQINVQLSMTVLWASYNKNLFCRVTVSATTTYGAPIPNVAFTGRFDLDPDTTCTDSKNAWPRTVSSGVVATGGTFTTDSPTFPYRARCSSPYSGARCVFTLTSITAAGYTCGTAACSSKLNEPVASARY